MKNTKRVIDNYLQKTIKLARWCVDAPVGQGELVPSKIFKLLFLALKNRQLVANSSFLWLFVVVVLL